MSIPIIAAASRSCEVACIALPVLVLVTRIQSSAISTKAETMMMIRRSGTRTLPMSNPLKKSAPSRERERVVVALVGPEEELHRVGEEERDAERADQRRDAWRVPERPVGEALDRHAEHGAARHRGERDQDEQEPDRDHGVGRAAEQLERAEADERAHHEDVAVGEVEELEDPVDERVAERDQRVDASEREAVQRQLDERVHAGARVYSA